MPLLIAHRGLIDGPNLELENKYEILLYARQQGFDIEVDVWFEDNKLWIGHDRPDYETSIDTLEDLADPLTKETSECHAWIHCKNILALKFFLNHPYRFNFFYHENDPVVLTSNDKIWTYPGKRLTNDSICVLPETTYTLWEMPSIYCYGFCSDRVNTLKDVFYPTMNSPSNRGWR